MLTPDLRDRRVVVPPLRKPAELRQNRITKDVVVPLRAVVSPDPSPGWRADTVERWSFFWQSKLASNVELSDEGALRRLFRLYDEIDRMWDAIEETGRVVEGSQGQPRPNPLFKQVETFQAEARQLEDRFGLSPMSRLKLGVTFADAHMSLSALNERLASRPVSMDGVWDEAEA